MTLFSLCSSADAFHKADDVKKKNHSKAIFGLLCITHVLPLACKSDKIMEFIYFDRTWGVKRPPDFHSTWILNGWNDVIIQPARDAVLSYYKVSAEIFPPSACAKSHLT